MTTRSRQQSAEEAEPQKRVVVRYVGSSHVREITAANWRQIGVEQDTLTWHRDPPGNDIPREQVTMDEEAYRRYILGDPDFREVQLED
jgi:hypothetical protein